LPEDPVAETRELSTRQCEDLLRAGVAGRVALSTATGPHIVPVNYSVLDDSIIIRTSPYSLLGTYGRDTTLAFEIDSFDRGQERGWSVQARGRVEVVTSPTVLDRIRQGSEPKPWASGARTLFLAMRWTELSGRQLGARWDPAQDLAVRTQG
jgi:hypothetical protein